MSALPLYKITEHMTNVLEALEVTEDGEARNMLLQAFEELEGTAETKLERIAALIRTSDAEAKVRRGEAKFHTDAAKIAENRSARLKKLIEGYLESIGSDSHKAGMFTVAMQANGGNPPVEIVDESLLGDAYVIRTPDKTAILDDLKAGIEVPGATLGERGRSLRIR